MVYLWALVIQLGAIPLAPILAQDEKSTDTPPSGDEMKAYLKLSEPGPEHKKLGMRVGNWKIAGTFYMAPDAPPMKSEASAAIRPILGGRYFRETFKGEYLGQEFTGIGIFGYDKGLKKYFSTWIDSMSTGLMKSEGTADGSGDVITYRGEYFDPMRKEMVKTRYVLTLNSRKTHSSVLFEVADDGSERKIMELIYTRAQRPDAARNRGKEKRKRTEKQNSRK